MVINNSKFIKRADVEFLGALCAFAFAHHGLCADSTTIVIEDSIDRANVAYTTTFNDMEDLKAKIVYNFEPGDTRATMLEAISHETTHAQQFHSRRLEYVAFYNKSQQVYWGFRWEGGVFNVPCTPEDYYKAPWEIEAFEEAPIVISGFLRQFGIDSSEVATNSAEVDSLFSELT